MKTLLQMSRAKLFIFFSIVNEFYLWNEMLRNNCEEVHDKILTKSIKVII